MIDELKCAEMWEVKDPIETPNKAVVAWIHDRSGNTPVLQMTDTGRPMRVPFGPSKFQLDSPGRYNLSIAVSNPDTAQAIKKIDEWAVSYMQTNHKKYFPKLTKGDISKIIAENYIHLFRPPLPDSPYSPLLHTKLLEPPRLNVCLFDPVKKQMENGTFDDIVKGSEMVPQVHIQGFWFQNRSNGGMWGITALTGSVLIFRTEEKDNMNQFILADGFEVTKVIEKVDESSSTLSPEDEVSTQSSVAELSSIFEGPECQPPPPKRPKVVKKV